MQISVLLIAFMFVCLHVCFLYDLICVSLSLCETLPAMEKFKPASCFVPFYGRKCCCLQFTILPVDGALYQGWSAYIVRFEIGPSTLRSRQWMLRKRQSLELPLMLSLFILHDQRLSGQVVKVSSWQIKWSTVGLLLNVSTGHPQFTFELLFFLFKNSVLEYVLTSGL